MQEPRHSPIFLRPVGQRRPDRSPVWFWVQQGHMGPICGTYRLLRRAGLNPRQARQRILYLLGTPVIH